MGAYILGLSVFTLVGVMIIAAIGVFGAKYLPVGGLSEHWPVLALLFVGLNLTQQTGMILSVRDNFGYHSWIDFLKTILKYIGQIGLVLLGYEAGGLVVGTALSLILVAPITFRLIGVRPAVPSRETIRSIWTFAKPKFPQGVLDTMMGRIDTLLLGVLATTAVVGYYNVALRISGPAVFVTQLIANGTYGDVSDLHSRGEAVTERLRHSASYSSILSVPLFLGALVMSREILVTAYSSQYAEAALYLVWIGLYRLLITQEKVYSSAVNGLDMPHTSFRISVFKFVCNIVGSVGLFFLIGPIGVVIGSTITQLAVYVVTVYVVNREVGDLTVVPRPLVHQLASGAAMAAVVWLIKRSVRLGSWVGVFALVGFGAVVYGAVLLAISEHHRATLRNVSGGMIGKSFQ